MKKVALFFALTLLLVACKDDDDKTQDVQEVAVEFSFTQNWDGQPISNANFEVTEYTNEHGEVLTLSKLVYLISDIEFVATDGTVYTAGDYNLIDARNETGLLFSPDVLVPEGTYEVRFTFGFDDEDNDQNYADLNSSDGTWNVPLIMGGGYHYMRMEGKFTSNLIDPQPENFQYHAIRANKHSSMPPDATTLEFTEDTSFEVSLGQITIQEGTNIEIQMNVSEWFKNPNTWDLTLLYTMLMPNYDAQIMMSENGAGGVFSLGSVNP